MILHTPETLTIRKYAKFEKSKDLRLLFRVWVPMWVAVKYSPKFIESFNRLFNSNADSELDKMRLKLLAQNKIMLMQALLMAVQTHLGEKVQLEMLRPGYNAHLTTDPMLAHYILEIEDVCAIKIESVEDIISFRNELERKIDKYSELFPEKEITKGVSILQLAFSVFSLMNMPFDGNIKLSEFAELKSLADERAKAMQQQIDKSNG